MLQVKELCEEKRGRQTDYDQLDFRASRSELLPVEEARHTNGTQSWAVGVGFTGISGRSATDDESLMLRGKALAPVAKEFRFDEDDRDAERGRCGYTCCGESQFPGCKIECGLFH